MTDFSILFNVGHVEWVELADVVPISGLVLHNDGLLIVLLVLLDVPLPLLILEELTVEPANVLPIDGELGHEFKGLVVPGDAGCELTGCEPLGDSCGSLRSSEYL